MMNVTSVPKVVSALAISVFLVGGRSSGAVQQAQAKEFQTSFGTVWTTILNVLQQSGESVTQADKENGLINTDFRSEDHDKRHYRLNLLVAKATDSTTNVSVTCGVEKRSGSIWANKRGRWEPKESDGSHEKQLLAAIEKALQSAPPAMSPVVDTMRHDSGDPN